ncbi:MAG TPA: hypothetical protein VJ994_00865 [Paracoccaceae bacterium]|nr:hypothetical protein [Paracoccaceae bacterium]
MPEVLAVLVVLPLLWLFYVHVPVTMARNRGRDAVARVLVAILGSPILAILLLAILGDRDPERR